MKIFVRLTSFFLALLIVEAGYSQCTPLPIINFVNPSFEGTPQPHVTPGPWSVCMPGQTPDTQPGSWGVTLPPTNGSSYLGLVHQVSASWQEGACEQLSTPFVSGTNYSFTIDLANSSTTGGGIVPGCAELQIWGGFGPCDDNSGSGVLLWSSGNITPMDVWMTYTVSFVPTQNFTWVMFRINSLGCNPLSTDQPYILVDNIGPVMPGNVNVIVALNQNVSCAGMNNGMATAHPVGQNPPFTFSWNSTPVQTDSVLDNVGPGSYTVTVTDANTCTSTATVNITQPQPIVLTPTVNNALCGATGSAYMSYSGGTAPFSFLWSNGRTTQNNSNLFAGTYTITATDANSCTATASIVVTQSTVLTVTGTTVDPTCTVGGTITAVPTGGTPGYSYSWNTTPVQATPTATNLSSGSYTVTVTDVNLCTASASFTLFPPPNSPVVTLTPSHVACFGQSTGSITSNITGGNPGFTYSWNTTPVQTTANAVNLPAGNYTVTVTDVTLCTASASATIIQPTALTATITKTDVLCFGQSTGTITATPSGGTSGYTYNWNSVPAQTTGTASNLPAGTYTATVTDANTCTITASGTISQPASPLSLSEVHTDVSCFGGNNGSATVTPSGGTTGYTYSWTTTPAQTTSTASNLMAGTYVVTVTDANNCTASISSTINQPATPVSVTATQTAPLCFGQPATTATANASGGTPGYLYSWNTVPVQNTQNVTNIPAGTYTVTAIDAQACSATATITIAPPPTALTLVTSHNDVLCFGDATGSVAVTASGSYGGYSYNWNTNPVQTTSSVSQLIAGTYNVTVTDIQGCSATASETISQPGAPLSLSTSTVDVLCFSNATGSATVTAAGGTPGYSYAWNTNPVQTTATASSLASGNYSVVVTDANFCFQTASVVINQPLQLQATSSFTNVDCNGASTGAITITVTGGVPAYSYQWNTTPSVNSPNRTGLPAGTYSVTITDANNCSYSTGSISITEPTAITLNPVIVNVSCPNHGDGSIDINPSGGTPGYTFNWSTGGSNSQINSNLSGGNYSVTVTDNNGCASSANNLIVAELPGVMVNGVVTNVLCFPLQNGSIDIVATTSFPPLSYLWSNGSTTEDLFALDTGIYSIVITDAHNCTADSFFYVGNDSIFSIDATPDTVTIDLGEIVNLNVTPFGSSFGTVFWIPAHGLNCTNCTSPVSSPLQSITYQVTGTDVNGCIATDTVRVNVIPAYTVFIPNAFTPNGDGANDYFEVFGNKEAWKQFDVKVFDRWGEKVYENSDMNFKWNGVYKDRLLNPAVFVYTVKVVYIDNYSEKLFTGTVTLIR